MALTLRKLLQNPSLHLRVLVGDENGSQDHESAVDRALDEEFEWLHPTDLLDPTPFLGPAEVILTLGWQFPVLEAADPTVAEVRVSPERLQRIYDDYAALIAAHGVIGVGFGSDVVHKGVPQPLIRACHRHGLVLFDVPYEISFMDLLQIASRVVQRDQTDRYTRSLRAQKAIANAAIRPDGLTATLHETARQLGCGVALYDAYGRATTTVAAPDGPRISERELAPLVSEMLTSGQRFRSAQVTPEVEVVLQQLGPVNDTSGILVLTLSRGFDDVSRNVLSSVLALVSVSLEQNQALATLHRTLREALMQLLISGNTAVTRHIVESVWGPMPEPPLVVLIAIPRHLESTRTAPSFDTHDFPEDLPVFFATYRSDTAAMIRKADLDRFLSLVEPFDVIVGWSSCDVWDGLGLALDEARKAAEVGLRQNRAPVTAFNEIWRTGVTDLIDASDATHVARRILGPLSTHDQEQGTDLLRTLRVWLEHHGRHLPTSRELGVHRHTLAHRLELIGTLTAMDLDDFQSRAELILALRYFRPEHT